MQAPLALVLLSVCVAVAAVTDVRSRKIPNVVVLPGIVAALFSAFYQFGWSSGLQPALYGALSALLVMVPLYALGVLGAGDAKLMCLVGAAIGVVGALQVAVVAIAISGVIGLVVSFATGKGKLLAANLQSGLLAIVSRDLDAVREMTVQTSFRVPFALAVAAALPSWYFFLA